MSLPQQTPLSPESSYRTITLSKGQVAIVDPADYDWLMQWSWHAGWNPHTKSYYAKRSERIKEADGTIRIVTFRMHRELLGLKPGDPDVDHKEPSQTLDNRRSNLRIDKDDLNKANSRIHSNNTSGFKGVSWHCRVGKFGVNIMRNGKNYFLGYFDDPAEAHKVRCAKAEELHGEFARNE